MTIHTMWNPIHFLESAKITFALIVFASMTASRSLVAAPSKQTLVRTVTVEGLDRTYYLHVPTNLPKNESQPLVLMFHGGGGTPAFAERESKFSEIADREGFIVAYPEGIGQSWNDGRANKTIVAQRDNIDDLAFVEALIDDVAKDHNVDPKRIFSTGISNGAMFSHHLALNLSSRIAAIAPVVGGIAAPSAGDFKPKNPVSVMIIQSTHDPIVPYDGGGISLPGGSKRTGIISTENAVKLWVMHNGCKSEPMIEDLADKDSKDGCRVQKMTYTKGRDGTEVVLYRIVNGGHTWPDGLQYLPALVVGKVCRDFNATTEIWEFFKAHPKP